MWTIKAYNTNGKVIALMATSCDRIASRMMDKLTELPEVITVHGELSDGGWPSSTPAIVIVQGISMLRRQAG